MLADIVILCCTVVAMEFGAWAAHRYIMHGWGWGWHRSHHRLAGGVFEKNDLYAVVFGVLAVGLFAAAPTRRHWLFWVAAGMTMYGILYAALHDGLVHRRWGPSVVPRHRYLRRLIQAHRLHHATTGREGAVSFGFLYAPPVAILAERLRRQRRRV